MKSVLITGATGSFGTAFVAHVLGYNLAERVCCYSRSESRQAILRAAFVDERLRLFIGDVRDKERLRRAMRDVEVVVHAAALKRIEVAYYDPEEVVKTNVVGTMNVIEAATLAGVEKVVLLSTDKAYQPVSPYGQSKAMAEGLMLAANNARGADGPRFAVTRYGNIWASAGSVVPVWKLLVADGRAVPVTSPECTRFHLRMSGAIDLVLRTIEAMPTEIAIPELPAYRIGDLAEAFGATMDVKGLPSFEKMHESLRDGYSSDAARRMSVDELRQEIACL